MADDKEYDAVIALGRSTTTLDLGGEVDGEAPVPPGLDRARVDEAVKPFLGTHLQAPPAVSAIKVGGERLYEKARRGEEVEVAAREVRLDHVEVRGVEGDRIALSLAVGKGFYVRSFARDLAKALGTLGHLAELRRTRNGAFTVAEAIDEAGLRDPETARARILSLGRAWSPRPVSTLTAAGIAHARAGRGIPLADLAPVPSADAPVALLDESGAFVAIASRQGERVRVIRGFSADL
jgi:tRNA pseudouridine55 synthase